MIKNINTMVETKNVKYVIGPGGVRMTYQEWIEMRDSERN